MQQTPQGGSRIRVETSQVLMKNFPPGPNITKEEAKTIRKLKKDSSRVILTADKG